MFGIILSLLFSALSIGVTISYWKKQTRYYMDNMTNLEKARNFFLEDPTYAIKDENNEKLIDDSGLKDELLTLVNELNKYISRNKGTTDFSIIQNKTERFAHTLYENAASNLALPTYYGLQGTFVGVFIGLIGFAFPNFLGLCGLNIESNEEVGILCLVFGVLVSMGTSFHGLKLTTKSNEFATDCKRELDERKNRFYDFIQNELMPVLGMSVVAALSQLRETLLHFHESFDVITDKFERTFNGCTDRFGKAFEKNIVAVGNAASQLGSSIEVVNKNVANQQALLKELRSDGMIAALDLFVNAGKEFGQAISEVKDLKRIHDQLSAAVNSLSTAQEEYNRSLVVPKLIAERLNVILERVSTFEESVNALGESIAQTHMLGNSEMNLIEEHLINIRRKDEIAAEFQETANEELKRLFDSEIETLKTLQLQYSSSIEEHNEAFSGFMDQMEKAIKEKNAEFMKTLEDAFDMTQLSMDFAHLRQIPEICECIGRLQKALGQFNADVKEQGTGSIQKLEQINESLEAIPPCVQDNSRQLGNQVSEQAAFLTEKTEAMTSTLNNLSEKTDAVSSSVLEVKGVAESIVANAGQTRKTIDSQMQKIVSSLNVLGIRLDSLKKDSEYYSNESKTEIRNVADGVKWQKKELETIARMLDRNQSESFARIVQEKLLHLENRMDALNERIRNLKK